MHYRLRYISLAAVTLILVVTSHLLSISSFEPFSAQAQTTQEIKAEGDRIFQTGIEQFHKGQFRQALETYQRVLPMMRELGNRAGEAATLHNIADVYQIQGQYENAVKFYEQALPIRREVKDRNGEAATLIGLGNTYIAYIESKLHYEVIKKPEELKPYQEVLKYYEQALVITREMGNRAGEAWSLNGIGMIYNALGTKREKPDALKFYQQALAIMREVGNRAGEAEVLFNIGKAYNRQFDRQRESRPISLDFYEQSLAIAREIGHRPLEAKILYRMGLTYNDRWGGEDGGGEDGKRRETALKFYKEALTIVRLVGDRPLEERVLSNIGSNYFWLGYPQTSQEYHEQALAIRQEMGTPVDWAAQIVKEAILVTYSTPRKRPTLVTILEGEGLIHYRNGDAHAQFRRYQAALESYQQALAIIRQRKNRPWEWVILNQMGKVYEKLGQLQVALDTYKQSLAIRREVDERAARESIPYTIRVAYGTDVNVHEPKGIRLEEGITNGLIKVGEGEPITTPITTVEDTNTTKERGRLQVIAGVAGRVNLFFVTDNEEEDTLTNIGNIYKALGQHQAALKSYQEALAILSEEMKSKESEETRIRRVITSDDGVYRQQEQRNFRSMGSVYEELGQYQAALESYQQSLAIVNQGSSGLVNQIPILLTNIGKMYEKLGQYQAALESYQQALASARKNSNETEEYIFRKYGQEGFFRRMGRMYEKPDEEALPNSIAKIYEQLGQNQAAQDYRQQALAFRREMGNHTEEDMTPGKAVLFTEMETDEKQKTIVWVNRLEGEGAILFAAGNTYSVQEQYQAALQSYQQLLKIVRQQGKRPWEWAILNQMGSVYEKLGQNQAALESYQQALLIRQEMDNRREEKAIYLDPALSGPRDLKVKIRLESGQVITFNPEGGVIFFAQRREDTLIKTGNVYRALGQNKAALEAYQQALAIVRNDETKRFRREGEILERIGSVYDNLQYEDALKAYQQLLTTVRQRNSPNEERQVLNSIGTAYKNLGQYQAALESYEQALAIVRKDKQRYPNTIHAEGTILNNIGTVYEQLGQYQAALESYKQSVAVVSDANWRQTALINIGSVSEKMGQHQAALESYEQALAIARGVNDRPVEGVILLHKGKVYKKMGQHQTALESYQQALVILRQVGNRVGEGQALNNIGEAYHYQGQHQTALEYYQQSLAVRQEVGDRTGKAVTLNNFASTLEPQSQSELAIIFYKQSVRCRNSLSFRAARSSRTCFSHPLCTPTTPHCSCQTRRT